MEVLGPNFTFPDQSKGCGGQGRTSTRRVEGLGGGIIGGTGRGRETRGGPNEVSEQWCGTLQLRWGRLETGGAQVQRAGDWNGAKHVERRTGRLLAQINIT